MSQTTPGRIVGIGGVFLRADDGAALIQWYREHLGLPAGDAPYAQLHWLEPTTQQANSATWSPFARDSDYFDADQQVMINYVVDDLEALLARLRAAGQRVDEDKGVQTYEYGSFAWAYDGEGNRMELWQPDYGWIDKARAEGGW